MTVPIVIAAPGWSSAGVLILFVMMIVAQAIIIAGKK